VEECEAQILHDKLSFYNAMRTDMVTSGETLCGYPLIRFGAAKRNVPRLSVCRKSG
jgi:hypothetical protein